jgi:precorrin-2 dehydrogenase/sirohydrochlorin ferrochelatase
MRIPMFIDVSDMKVLVLGGGDEGLKKTKRFLKHGAKVTIYSLKFNDELLKLNEEGKVKLVKGDVRDSYIVEELILKHDIIVYTIPNLHNIEEWVIKRCKELHKLYNIAVDASKTQVVMPIEVSGAGLRIAVTSEGKSTLVSKLAAEEIGKYVKAREDIRLFLEIMRFVKSYMRENKIHYKKRMEIYYKLFQDEGLRSLVKELKKDEAIDYTINFIKRCVK